MAKNKGETDSKTVQALNLSILAQLKEEMGAGHGETHL
jgi:hypothetical protein